MLVTSIFSFAHNVFYSNQNKFLFFESTLFCRMQMLSIWTRLNPLPDDKFKYSSKLKEFADDNFRFDQNGRKLSKWVENTVGKGELAHYDQFLLFPQCFQKACFPGASKGIIVWEWVKFCRLVNPLQNKPLFSCVCSTSLLKTQWEKEKLLVTSNFSFSHSVFYPFE